MLHPLLLKITESMDDASHQSLIVGIDGLRIPVPVGTHDMAARTKDAMHLLKKGIGLLHAFQEIVGIHGVNRPVLE
jgi:hypothetical protein